MNQEKNTPYEVKKKERELEREMIRKQSRRQEIFRKLRWWSLWLVLIVLVVYGIYLLGVAAAPKGEDFSVAYETIGRNHIPDGAPRPAYNSNPPSSGPHYSSPARGGFYDEPLPDERVVHNLEHGDIWIAYRPNIDNETKNALKSFAGQYVVVSPRTENNADISLVAWGRVDAFDMENDTLNEENEGRIRDFIKRYDNRGPEKVRGIQPTHSF